MGWLITLGILSLLAILPLGVSMKYDENGPIVKLIVGPAKIPLYPAQKKADEPKENKKTAAVPESSAGKEAAESVEPEQPKSEKPVKPSKKSGGPITDFLPLVQTALEMLGAFRRRLRVELLELKLIMAADDPCDLAVNYGRAWAAVGNLMPRIEKVFVIKKRNIEVECDFESTETRVAARLDLTITFGRILATVVVYGIRALIEFLRIKNKRKGGASK